MYRLLYWSNKLLNGNIASANRWAVCDNFIYFYIYFQLHSISLIFHWFWNLFWFEAKFCPQLVCNCIKLGMVSTRGKRFLLITIRINKIDIAFACTEYNNLILCFHIFLIAWICGRVYFWKKLVILLKTGLCLDMAVCNRVISQSKGIRQNN